MVSASGIQTPFGFNDQYGYQYDVDSKLIRLGHRFADAWNRINDLAGEIDKRVNDLRLDPLDLYHRSPIGEFSYKGHQQKLRDVKQDFKDALEDYDEATGDDPNPDKYPVSDKLREKWKVPVPSKPDSEWVKEDPPAQDITNQFILPFLPCPIVRIIVPVIRRIGGLIGQAKVLPVSRRQPVTP